MVREKGWRDIGNAIGTMLVVSAIDIGGTLSEKLDTCAQQGDSPRDTYRRRDIITAMLAKPAQKTAALRNRLTGEFGPLLSITGMFGGTAAGFGAASGIWGLLAGKGIAAGVAGLAAGIAIAPLAAAAIGVGVSIVLPMLGAAACFWPTMVSNGFREAALCRLHRQNPHKTKAPQAPKKPPVMENLESDLRIIGMEKAPEREEFFRNLRKRFPEEFNEAANLDAHDPVLRGPVTVKGPLKFRTPAKTPSSQKGGTL